MNHYKVIQDSIHGSIRVEEPFLSLMATPEFERLSHIHQLGLAYLVFPGAHHTRFEHSIGTFHIARRMTQALKLEREEMDLVSAAALLHDIGHGPYSHTLEGPIHSRTGLDHMDITKRMISHGFTPIPEDYRFFHPTIPEILDRAGIDRKKVAELVNSSMSHLSQLNLDSIVSRGRNGQTFFGPEKNYLAQIIHSPLDADQMDYLVRDAHYTGVVQGGAVDIDRILNTLTVYNGELAIDRRGLSAVEGILVARALMYTSVYFHKTVRIAQQMLIRGVQKLGEDADIRALAGMTDCELMTFLASYGGVPAEIARRLRSRNLYKVAYSVSMDSMSEEERRNLASLSREKKAEVERRIAGRCGIDDAYVILDIPSRGILLSEPRFRQTDVNIVSDGKLTRLGTHSPMSRALQLRPVHQWGLIVSTLPEHVEQVYSASKRVLEGL